MLDHIELAMIKQASIKFKKMINKQGIHLVEIKTQTWFTILLQD